MTLSSSALLFAGQGAQFVGMAADLAAAFPVCSALFDRASQVLGWNLGALCFKGPEADLTRSDRCQPAVFVAGLAAFRALEARAPGLNWAAAAGLSLGEWAALHAAGVLSFDDTLRVLEARGRFMQQACEERPGGMLCVIGLSGEKLVEVCGRTGVEAANYNSGEQTVLSGERDRIADAGRVALELGAKRAITLNVAGAYHSSLMSSAAARAECRGRLPLVAHVVRGRAPGGVSRGRGFPGAENPCAFQRDRSPARRRSCRNPAAHGPPGDFVRALG